MAYDQALANAHQDIEALQRRIREIEERVPPGISKVLIREGSHFVSLPIVGCHHDGSGFVVVVDDCR